MDKRDDYFSSIPFPHDDSNEWTSRYVGDPEPECFLYDMVRPKIICIKFIDIFFIPIYTDNHHYVIVINLAKNKGYVIDRLNQDQAYAKNNEIYMKRALALLLICQQLKIPNFVFHVPISFNIQTFKFKTCFIPPQKDVKSYGIIVMMDIYQKYICSINFSYYVLAMSEENHDFLQ